MKAKQWMMEYGVAMMLAILLAVVLGHLPLFRDTAVGKLHASDVVQFMGYGTASYWPGSEHGNLRLIRPKSGSGWSPIDR
jgi:hypothetical protein